MCFHSKLAKEAWELEHRFNVVIHEEFYPTEHYNGFEFPRTPIITNTSPKEIQLYEWGLIPPNSKVEPDRTYTLNARIETLEEKYSFKNVVHNRCLVIANGYYEWQWLTQSGSKKQKYLLHYSNNELFAFAGLWSHWTNPQNGLARYTYTIVTSEANELLSVIHNNKKRMPVILRADQEMAWLSGKPLEVDMNLPLEALAMNLPPPDSQASLF